MRDALKFQFVDEIDQGLDIAFGEALKGRKWTGPGLGTPPQGEAEDEGPVTVVSVTDGQIDADGEDTILAE